MIARVYPITRLPRHCTFFDFLIPKHLTVQVGDLILCSFRGRILHGIVCGVVEQQDERENLLTLERVVKTPYLTPQDIERIKHIARIIAQSPSSLFAYALPEERKNTRTSRTISYTKQQARLSQEDIAFIHDVLQRNEQFLSIAADNEVGIALALGLAKQLKKGEQMFILVPHDKDAESIASYLPQNLTSVVTGMTSLLQRKQRCEDWRNGQIPLLVGTKQAALWFPRQLGYVLVLGSGNDEFANQRRNPRFDPREAAFLLAQQHQARMINIDPLPRPEDLYMTLVDKTETSQRLVSTPTSTCIHPLLTRLDATTFPQIINLRNKEERTANPLLTNTLLNEIKMALQSQKKVLLFLNRKGVARRLQCSACGYVPLCGTCGNIPTIRAEDLVCDRCFAEMWVPDHCPSCQKRTLKYVGMGGEKVAHTLQQAFPDARIALAQKGENDHWQAADILIATEYFFTSLAVPFMEQQFDLVADLATDLSLHHLNFRAQEHTARHLLRLTFFAHRQKAKCLAQTWLPDEITNFLSVEQALEKEFHLRQTYGLPPFGYELHLSSKKGDDLPKELDSYLVQKQEKDDKKTFVLRFPSFSNKGSGIPDLYGSLPSSWTLTLDGPYGDLPRTSRTE